MTNTSLVQFKELLDRDGLLLTEIEDFCTTMYRIDDNPLPIMRKWLKRNNMDVPIHYIESDITAKHSDDIMLRVCGRAIPLIIVEAVKIEGLVAEVNIYFISDTILNRRDFN